MKPFNQLTQVGKARRLRTVALAVLADDYALTDLRLRLVSMHSFNTIFRVDSAAGRFALRVGDVCRIHPDRVEDVEAAWLDALAADGFGVAQNVPTTEGDRWTTATAVGVPHSRVCTLFTWLDGHEMTKDPLSDSIERAGQLQARLHLHAEAQTLSAPESVHARSAIYFADTDLVASYQSPHGSLFAEATARVQQLIDGLWQAPGESPHLLHGDFGPHNIMRWRDQLTPIDFQDLRYGFPVQDLGIALTDLGRRAPDLVDRFMAGYTQIAQPPELTPDQLATFAAARSLNIMNLALHSPGSGIGRALATHASRVVEWMNE